MTSKIVTLSGGVGGAKLVLGLSHVVEGEALLVACNTGDDFQHLGLTIVDPIELTVGSLPDLGVG